MTAPKLTLKWKMAFFCAVAGATAMMAVWWRWDGSPFWWSWILLTMLCNVIVWNFEIPFAGVGFKFKVAVPSVLYGAALVLTSGSLYYWRENFYNSGGELDFPVFLIWGAAAALFAFIASKVKEPVPPTKKQYVSNIVFEIVGEGLVYRGWDILGDHLYEETPDGIVFGKSGISLSLVDGKPKLRVPGDQEAELVLSDHAFQNGGLVEGKFVEVRIY